jgi:hypothetical protein
MGQTTPIIERFTSHSHDLLEVCIRDNIYTWELCAGLGWNAAASGSVIGPELYQNWRNYDVMGQTTPIIEKFTFSFTSSFGSMYKEPHTRELGAGLGWDAAASQSVIGPELY